MKLVERGQKMRDDDVHLEFGKPHAETRMPSGAPTHISIWHFLVLGALGEVARGIPLLRVGIDSGIVMSGRERICLGRTERLVHASNGAYSVTGVGKLFKTHDNSTRRYNLVSNLDVFIPNISSESSA